jgi:cytochrome b
MINQEGPMQYVWDPFVRIFHWTLVIAFSVAFYTHASEWERLIHVRAGYTAGALLIARIIWGLMKTGYASFRSFPFDLRLASKHIYSVLKGSAKRYIGHNPAGSLVIYAMLATGLTAVSSGWLVYNEGWLFNQPEFFQRLHQYSTWGWLILVTMHITGVVAESIIHRDNIILAMITGCKRVSRKGEKQASIKIS